MKKGILNFFLHYMCVLVVSLVPFGQNQLKNFPDVLLTCKSMIQPHLNLYSCDF